MCISHSKLHELLPCLSDSCLLTVIKITQTRFSDLTGTERLFCIDYEYNWVYFCTVGNQYCPGFLFVCCLCSNLKRMLKDVFMRGRLTYSWAVWFEVRIYIYICIYIYTYIFVYMDIYRYISILIDRETWNIFKQHTCCWSSRSSCTLARNRRGGSGWAVLMRGLKRVKPDLSASSYFKQRVRGGLNVPCSY